VLGKKMDVKAAVAVTELLELVLRGKRELSWPFYKKKGLEVRTRTTNQTDRSSLSGYILYGKLPGLSTRPRADPTAPPTQAVVALWRQFRHDDTALARSLALNAALIIHW
jgi:hypothetical protein